MVIQGLQKLTLLDYPGKVACTLFTAGCNFRCPFCHNASLVTHVDRKNDIPEEEVLAFLKKRRGLLDGVCITGGEPLLQPDIEVFIRKIRDLGYLIKLDTNGSNILLLKRLAEEGLLDYVAMDIKNAPDKYGVTIGIEEYDLENILQSVEFLLSGSIPYEFRTTVVREFHKREDFAAIGRWIRGAEKYYLQSFQDSGDLIAPGLRGYTKEIMEQALEIVRKNVPNAELRGVE
ncbi:MULTISPECIES: anaerobic ribonucleoside-triphosphate reductase activating protein [Lachnospiraceae]|jgi:pyruvate formate lyase activating enzyme|uniref:Anaerobic ribonucleoside-triphosphate reductase activating protein n=1 Tax=Faecalicatena acetigenes TaxID=2981790 RepID=A0ABT2T9S7_9FIRM|nr:MULTISPECIES: anaerobic ribonucleoside-triphosphate reductase activating protein [Lachnospiraceae]MCU6746992.1 anaerobic ribonucleoside-triphosphate reductase activating protein [Faecalicatena acetigenes]SCH57613.1 Molybdenum cofactor biosynthesis protein A [uncultured Clostridium sp.]